MSFEEYEAAARERDAETLRALQQIAKLGDYWMLPRSEWELSNGNRDYISFVRKGAR